MIRRKWDLLIKSKALKNGSPFFLDINDNIPEHFKRVNKTEKFSYDDSYDDSYDY